MQQADKSVGRGGFTLLIWVLLLLLGCVLFFFRSTDKLFPFSKPR